MGYEGFYCTPYRSSTLPLALVNILTVVQRRTINVQNGMVTADCRAVDTPCYSPALFFRSLARPPVLPAIRTRSYQGHVYKHALGYHGVPVPSSLSLSRLSAHARFPFFSFCLSSLHSDSGA